MIAQMVLTVNNVTWMVHIELNQNAIVMKVILKQIFKFVVNALKIVKIAQMQQVAMDVLTIWFSQVVNVVAKVALINQILNFV